MLTRLGAKRSAWNPADIRGEAERLIASVGVVAERPVRHELVEDIADRARTRCVPLLDRDDVPEHVRSLTSERVLAVEADLVDSIAARSARPVTDAAGSAASRTSTPPNGASSRPSPATPVCS